MCIRTCCCLDAFGAERPSNSAFFPDVFLMRFFQKIFSARRLIHTQLFHPGAVVSHAPSHGSSAVYLGAAAAVTTAFGFQNPTRCETEDVHEGWDVLRLDEVKLQL